MTKHYFKINGTKPAKYGMLCVFKPSEDLDDLFVDDVQRWHKEESVGRGLEAKGFTKTMGH